MFDFTNCSALYVSNGRSVRIVNGTPHAITFKGENGDFTVPSSVPVGEKTGPAVLSAKQVSVSASDDGLFVKTEFLPTPEGQDIIDAIRSQFANEDAKTVIVGSMVAAQAYPGQVVQMCPAQGFEHVPPAEKRMDPFKFSVFG